MEYTKETKKILDDAREVRCIIAYFPKLKRETEGRLLETLKEGYVRALTDAINEIKADIEEWERTGAEIFKKNAETKCGMAAGFMCDTCGRLDCESNPERIRES